MAQQPSPEIVRHHQRRHHVIVHSSTGIKHLVEKEEEHENIHRHHSSPRRHYQFPESIETHLQFSQKKYSVEDVTTLYQISPSKQSLDSSHLPIPPRSYYPNPEDSRYHRRTSHEVSASGFHDYKVRSRSKTTPSDATRSRASPKRTLSECNYGPTVVHHYHHHHYYHTDKNKRPRPRSTGSLSSSTKPPSPRRANETNNPEKGKKKNALWLLAQKLNIC